MKDLPIILANFHFAIASDKRGQFDVLRLPGPSGRASPADHIRNQRLDPPGGRTDGQSHRNPRSGGEAAGRIAEHQAKHQTKVHQALKVWFELLVCFPKSGVHD